MATKEKLDESLLNEDHRGATQAHYEELAAQSSDNRKLGSPDVEIDLIATHTVKFTKDFGFIKKGSVLTISDTAYNIYKKADVVQKQ
jgi:hypothetical protein